MKWWEFYKEEVRELLRNLDAESDPVKRDDIDAEIASYEDRYQEETKK